MSTSDTRLVLTTLIPASVIPAELRRRVSQLAIALVAVLLLVAPATTAQTAATQAVTAQAAASDAKQATEWKSLENLWYVSEIAGSPAGWTNERVETSGDLVRSVIVMQMKISRGATALEISSESVFIETLGGKPVSFSVRSKMGAQETVAEYEFGDNSVTITSKQGQRTVTTERPVPEGDWMTPYAAAKYFDEQRRAGAKLIEYTVLMPDNGLDPVTMTHRLDGRQQLKHDGRNVEVARWKSRNSIMDVESKDLFNEDGLLLYSEANIGFGAIVQRLSDERGAMAAVGGPAPELMIRSFIEPDRPLPNAMKTKRAVLRLKARQGELPELPNIGAQRFEYEGDSKSVATIIVDLSDNADALEGDVDDKANTGASLMIDPDDDMVAKLAARAVRRAGDDVKARASALRAFVYQHINRKGYETAFATASETAKLRTGDCSEHAVLLAAMLRAVDIPARVATGLVYVDALGENGIFGWHMWTQALIDGKWVDYDATLPVDYHAGHVLTSTSTLDDGSGDGEMSSLMSLIGNLDIDIVEYSFK